MEGVTSEVGTKIQEMDGQLAIGGLFKVAEHSLWAVSGNPRDGACFKLDK